MRNSTLKTFSVIVALFLPFFVNAQLTGNYTINSSGSATASNYLSVGAAISDLVSGVRADGGPINGPGVSGPVTLRIAAGTGPYNEQVSIPSITGASATNTIRLTGGSTRETIQFTGTTTTDRHVIRLSGAKHVTLDSLTITNNDAVYGYGVWLTNAADSNRVTNSVVSVNPTATTSNFAGITLSGGTVATNGNWGNYNLIQGNSVNGGYYGITCRGTSTTVYSQGNQIIGNTVRNTYYYPIYAYYQNLLNVNRNDVANRVGASTGAYGIYLYYVDRFECNRNKVDNAGNNGIYSYYGNYQGGTPTSRSSIANNMIGGTWIGTGPYGIALSTNCTNLDIVHNSILITSGNGRGISMTSGSGNVIQNNAIVHTNSTTGYGLYVTATTNVTTVNNNAYWVPGSSNFVYVGAAYTTGTFIGGGGYNTNSVNSDALFASNSNLHVGSGANLYNLGANVGVTEDFDGDLRPMNGGYDIGADEHTPALNDVSPTSLASPVQPFSAGIQPVNVILRNLGIDTLRSATVNWNFNGLPQAPAAFSGTVAPLGFSAPLSLGTANFTAGVPHAVQVITSLPNGSSDANPTNDTLNLLICSALSGTYTIGGVGADFATINDAVDALICGGVSGPVVMQINAAFGPYNEQVIIPAIAGATGNNTIRFTGGSGMATVSFSGTTITERAVIKLSGAKRIILDSLTVINNDLTYGFGIHLTNDADSNSVLGCNVIVDSTSTSSNFCGILVGGQTPTTNGNWGDFNTISGNTVRGGYYGISIRGTSTTVFSFENKINDNAVYGSYYYGIMCYAQYGTEINRNHVEVRAPGTTASYGIYVGYTDDFQVSRNRIYQAGTYGIYFTYGNYNGGVPGPRAEVVNNMIGAGFRATTSYGIYLTTNCIDMDIFHNSISVNTASGRGIYIGSGTGNDVRNNVFSLTSGNNAGYPLYVVSATNVSAVDYNDYWAPNSTNFVYIAAAYTPATYIGGGGFNLNSRNLDPYFMNEMSDLHSFGSSLYDAGTTAVVVSEDFDGDARPLQPLTNPDMGADEYSVDSLDTRPVSVVAPTDFACPDSFQVVSVVIFNQGTDTLFNLPVSVNYSGVATGSLSGVLSGPLAFGNSDTLILGTINTWPGGVLNLQVITNLVGDQEMTNDTLNVIVSLNTSPAAPVALGTQICQSDSTTIYVDSTGATHYWFDANAGGNLVASGDTILTPPLGSTTTYYVEARGRSNSSLPTIYTGGNGCGGGNMIDIFAYNSITIDSFDTNLDFIGTSVVDVYYKAGTYAGFETIGTAWTLLGSATVTSAGVGIPTRVNIGGLTIPAGQTYAIYLFNPYVEYTTLGATYSNADMAITTGVGLCSLFGGTNNPRTWNGEIYYSAEGCPSTRTAVTVNVIPTPVAAISDSALCGPSPFAAAPGYSYNWSSGDTTQATTISTTGMYYVTVTDQGCSSSDSAFVTVNALPVVNLGADTAICAGQTLNLDAGNPGLVYNWSSGDSTQAILATSGATYSVFVTDTTGCSGMDSITIGIAPLPAAVFNFSPGAAGLQYSFTDLSTGTPTSWSWSFGDGAVSTQANPSHTYAGSGSYTVTLIVSNACGSDTMVQVISVVGIQNGLTLGEMTLSPNPTSGKCVVNLVSSVDETTTLTILDANGRLVNRSSVQLKVGENRLTVDLSNQSQGLYFVHLQGSTGTASIRAVKN